MKKLYVAGIISLLLSSFHPAIGGICRFIQISSVLYGKAVYMLTQYDSNAETLF